MFSALTRQTKLYKLQSDALHTGLVDCTSTNPAHVESAPELTPVKLLASPTFHRAVRSVHKKVHELQHGKDPAEMGGVNIDGQPTPLISYIQSGNNWLMTLQSPADRASRDFFSTIWKS
jgi:hypothetical protein